jgi:MFS family permease
MLAGFLLLAGLDEHSARSDATLATVVLGLGLGLLMQNLVLVIQNAVPSRMLGVATSTGQLFRTVGGTIGVSVMGAILSAGLPVAVDATGFGVGTASTPAARHALAHAMHPVFLIGAPVMAVTLLIVLLIPEVPLRRTVRDEASSERAVDSTPVPA